MVFQFIFLEMYFVNFSVNIVRYAHCNYELFQEERKILLEKCMTDIVLAESSGTERLFKATTK